MPFQILSLSGGGYLGLYTISVLSELERRVKRPIPSCFDLLVGTSVGGIIALGLAAEKSTCQIKPHSSKMEPLFSRLGGLQVRDSESSLTSSGPSAQRNIAVNH